MATKAKSNQKQAPKLPPLQPVPGTIVDMTRMMGLWYILAQKPTPFGDKGAHNATEFYEWGKEEKVVVKNDAGKKEKFVKPTFRMTVKFNNGSFTGKETKMKQKGAVAQCCKRILFNLDRHTCVYFLLGYVLSEDGAVWLVKPKLLGMYLPVKLQFVVVERAEDYSWVTIGNSTRNYLWILSRTTTLSPEVFQQRLVCLHC